MIKTEDFELFQLLKTTEKTKRKKYQNKNVHNNNISKTRKMCFKTSQIEKAH